MAEINLLPVEEKTAEFINLWQKRLTIVSVIFLVITAVFTIAILIFFTSLAAKRADLNSKIQESSTAINDQKAVEELVVVVKKKVTSAEKVFSERLNYPQIFEKLGPLVPQGVYFSDLKFSGSKMVISGKARGSADIAGLVSSFVSAQGAEIVSNVSVDSLASDDKGSYSFSITTQLMVGQNSSSLEKGT